MLRKFLILSILPILVCGLLIAKPVQAKGFSLNSWNSRNFGKTDLENWAQKMEKMFENWANFLQISVEKVKNYWAEGKTPKEMMKAENINPEEVQKRREEKKLAELKSRLQKLVEKGIITQEEADKRFETMKKWWENQKEKKILLRKNGKGFKNCWFSF